MNDRTKDNLVILTFFLVVLGIYFLVGFGIGLLQETPWQDGYWEEPNWVCSKCWDNQSKELIEDSRQCEIFYAPNDCREKIMVLERTLKFYEEFG